MLPNRSFHTSETTAQSQLQLSTASVFGIKSVQCWRTLMPCMAIRVVEFSNGEYKIRKFLSKNQHTQRKLLNFENWVNGEVSKSVKIWLSKSNFYVEIIRIFLIFFFIEEYRFRSTFFVIWHFLITSIFKTLYFLKWCPIFDSSPLSQSSKVNNFLWVCWFLGKNLSSFVPPFEKSTTRIAIPCNAMQSRHDAVSFVWC